MDFATYFPIWDKLTPAQQKKIEDATYFDGVCSTDFCTGWVFPIDGGKYRLLFKLIQCF
mgnify:CR=1 FL=1